MVDIALVCMPFAVIERPSISLGVLKTALAAGGFSSRIHYANIRFAELIGLGNYFFTSNHPSFGDWMFRESAFPESTSTDESYLDRIAKDHPGLKLSLNGEFRDEIMRYIDRMVDEILADKPRIVGCSSVFQQHVASLALLRRLRQRAPEVVTMLGGTNCEGTMGLTTHREFQWVDYVVSGDADQLLPKLCHQILHLDDEPDLSDLPPGVLGPAHRKDNYRQYTYYRAVVDDMSAVHMPDYDDYFAALEASPLRDSVTPVLLIETSRGCWWGAKKQCTFCGLNGDGTKYRAKSADRVLGELESLSGRYGVKTFNVVDNIIPGEYFETLLPRLASSDVEYKLFYETRTHLNREKIEQMAAAGIVSLQPGIESLHDEILKTMNKGVSACMNVRFLKWAHELGLHTSWTIMVDVPGAQMQWYQEMADLIPLITHLQAPINGKYGLSKVRYVRFSAYLKDPDAFGLHLEPHWSYPLIYPLSKEACADIAYFFEDTQDQAATDLRSAYGRLYEEMKQWQRSTYDLKNKVQLGHPALNAQRPILEMIEHDDSLHITDTRPCAVRKKFRFTGLLKEIYLFCDPGRTLPEILRHDVFVDEDEEIVRAGVAGLIEKKLLAHIGNRYLSLATTKPCRPIASFASAFGGVVVEPQKRRVQPSE